jgi:arginase
MLKKIVNVTQVRCSIGQKNPHVNIGSKRIISDLNKTSGKQIPSTVIKIKTCEDYKSVYMHNKKLCQRPNTININLGGDHSISASTIQPYIDHYKKDLLVIWVDAHADVNTQISSLTNNSHGMPVACLLGLMNHWYNESNEIIENNTHDKKINRFSKLLPSNLMYCGLRDIDPFEKRIIKNLNIKHFGNFNKKVIKFIKSHPAKYIYISFDIDSIQPLLMPSTGTPVPNGLSIENVEDIIKTSSDRLIGFDLVEFNPMIGTKQEVKITLNNITRILKLLL